MVVRKARTFILACIAAAALIAASPVWAQQQPASAGSAAGKSTTGQEPTRDPADKDQRTGGDETAKDRNSIECFDGKTSDVDAPLDPNCGKDDALDPRFPGRVVVTLPDILVDLFGGPATTVPGGGDANTRSGGTAEPAAARTSLPVPAAPRQRRKRSPRTAAGSTRRQTHPQRFSPLPPDDRR